MPAFVPDALDPRELYTLLTSLVVPRPIAWISTLGTNGVRNLAPHSYYNIVSSAPPIVHFTSSGAKDTLANVQATGEFVVNVVSRDLLAEMNATAAGLPPDEDEFRWADLEAVDSETVAPPRVARARAALECRRRQVLAMGNGTMVFGDVTRVVVDDAVWRDGRVDHTLLEPVGRLAGAAYALLTDTESLPRPTWEDVSATGHDR